MVDESSDSLIIYFAMAVIYIAVVARIFNVEFCMTIKMAPPHASTLVVNATCMILCIVMIALKMIITIYAPQILTPVACILALIAFVTICDTSRMPIISGGYK
jgi:hypothetical protein